MLYGCSCSPFAPRSKRWKSLSVFWLCFPWEPQAASCRTPSWIGWEAESTSTALAISAAVSTWAEPLPTMSTRVSNSKLWPEETGPSLHLLALAALPGKTVFGSKPPMENCWVVRINLYSVPKNHAKGMGCSHRMILGASDAHVNDGHHMQW